MRLHIKYFNHTILFVALMLINYHVNAQTLEGFKHDFASKEWDTTDRICVICHTPHNTTVEWPLWDFSITKSAYTLYMTRIEHSDRRRPEGTSKLCLSCHDGTMAVDAYGGAGGYARMETDAGNIKTNFGIRGEEHPISILYDGETASSNLLKDPTTTIVNLASSDVPVSVAAGMLSPAHKVECATCHDVHKKALSDEKEDHYDYGLLIMKMGRGQLCLACHF